MPFSHTSQPRPQAPRVGDSQLSSTKRTSCTRGSRPSSRQAPQVQLQDRQRRGFDHHLVLVVVLQAERVLAVAAVGRPARGLHVGGAPGLRAHGAQEGRGVEGAGADLHVVGLQDHAAVLRPVALQAEDQLLEGARRAADFHWTGLFSTPKSARVYGARRRTCALRKARAPAARGHRPDPESPAAACTIVEHQRRPDGGPRLPIATFAH